MNNLSLSQGEMHDYSKAIESYEESLKIRRELASANPQAYLPKLAATLVSLAIFYRYDVPDREQSIRYAREVLTYRSSIEHIPDAQKYIRDAEKALSYWNEN